MDRGSSTPRPNLTPLLLLSGPVADPPDWGVGTTWRYGEGGALLSDQGHQLVFAKTMTSSPRPFRTVFTTNRPNCLKAELAQPPDESFDPTSRENSVQGLLQAL
jgi:hypothetical protein